ncbi:MAG: arsenic efflux protein [Clostridia bacterium]|nr:arsenic efflux protein [Clostridia bacterium]
MTHLLHVHGEVNSGFTLFLDEVIIHGVLDTLKLLPFLFLTYLLMEFIEHRAGERFSGFMKKSGRFGPLAGAALGALPQCGFSVVAANLYVGRVISAGTLVAVFLSTSDEMLPILIGGGISVDSLLIILLYKLVIAATVGFVLDFALKLFGKPNEDINIDELCENDNCHCERGICYSALHHTLTVGGFVLLATLALNLCIFILGKDTLASFVGAAPALSHLVCTLLGLIPNCAASVILSELYCEGIITAGAMLSGLFTGAGVGILVLLRLNKKPKENLGLISVLVLSGLCFGLLFDVLPFGF